MNTKHSLHFDQRDRIAFAAQQQICKVCFKNGSSGGGVVAMIPNNPLQKCVRTFGGICEKQSSKTEYTSKSHELNRTCEHFR